MHLLVVWYLAPFSTFHSFRSIVLGEAHSLFKSQFSKECDLVLRLLISSTFAFSSSSSCFRLLPCFPVTSILSLYFSFSDLVKKAVPKQYVTSLVIPSFYYMYIYIYIYIYTIFLSSLAPCSTSFFSPVRSNWFRPSFCYRNITTNIGDL